MANDQLTLFNQAVSAAGGKGTIVDPDENSREANLCRLWYEVVRDNVLQAGPWSSVKGNTRLALLAERNSGEDWAEATDPGPGWAYAYSQPSDMIRPRLLFSYAPFEIQIRGTDPVIMTNQVDAILQYSRRVTDVSKWDNELYFAVVFSLAAHITLPLSGKQSLLTILQEAAREKILLAATDVANEQQTRQEGMPSMLAIRDFETPPATDQFTYPYATLNSVPS